MKIAVLGWGSLTWDPRDLAIEGPFLSGGPELPLEFSRISGGNRLTLVVDETAGLICPTLAARSSFNDLTAALTNLWSREGSGAEKLPANIPTSGRVGFVNIASGEQSAKAMERHPTAVASIRKWGSEHDFGAVIWTSLASNFREKTGADFSVDAAMQHLDGLEKLRFSRALNYIWNAPPEIQTPLRTKVNERWPLRDG